MEFLSDLVELVKAPNFVAGGPFIISLSTLFLFGYVMREVRQSEKACHDRMDTIYRKANDRLVENTNRCTAAIEKDSESKTKLAETLAIHTKVIENFQRILETRL